MAITKLVLNGTEYPIGNLITVDGPQLYEGRELEEYSWAELKEKIGKADFADLRPGDYKTIQLTDGETVVCQIAGIDTYYRTTNIELGHHIDWISKDCLSQTYKWNNSATNNGTQENQFPYMASDIKKTLNDTIYPTLPDNLKAVISDKTSLLEKRYNAERNLTDSNGWDWQNMGKLWLPSEYEVFGSTIWGTKGWSSGQACQYPLFANSWKHRIKGAGHNGSRCAWWLCTVGSGDSTACCLVDYNGGARHDAADTTWNRVPVCFRITG